MTTYKVSVELDNDTLAALNNGFQMQVFKGVKAAKTGGLPTVWFAVKEFSSTVTASWSETYGGYFSDTKVIQGVTVNTSVQKSMNPGDVITLADDGSANVSTIGGVRDSFSFKSEKQKTWTSGLMVAPEGQKLAPICAFPQYGAFGNIIQPYEKILILFAQKPLDTGAVVETAVSASVSITLATSVQNISVAFNINKGWDTKGNPQAKVNQMNLMMAEELIFHSASLANMMND